MSRRICAYALRRAKQIYGGPVRYRFLTPHQFAPLSPYVDTWLLTSYSPFPLDIAVPHGASQFIVEEMGRRLQQRFMGRIAQVDIGGALMGPGLADDFLAGYLAPTEQPIRYGVVLVDRMLLREQVTWQSQHGIEWLAVDWWSWFRRRVSAQRLAEAWLYLCLNHPEFRASHEFLRMGIDGEAAAAMAEQGQRLLAEFTDAIAHAITSLWQQPLPLQPQA